MGAYALVMLLVTASPAGSDIEPAEVILFESREHCELGRSAALGGARVASIITGAGGAQAVLGWCVPVASGDE